MLEKTPVLKVYPPVIVRAGVVICESVMVVAAKLEGILKDIRNKNGKTL